MASLTLKDISHLVKFDGNNFHEWEFGSRLLLETHGLLDVIDGVEKIPSEIIVERAVTNQKMIDEWKSKNLNARNYLFFLIERKKQSTLFGCKTSHDMWQRLTIQHAQSAAENKHLLMRKFFEYKYQPEHDVTTHISTIEQLASQLTDLKEPISESQLITKILITLPSSFRYFLSVWDNVTADQKTIQLLTQRLLKEENFSKLYLDTKPSSTDDQAFSSQPHRPFRGQRERNRGGFGARRGGHPYQTNRKCHYCGGTSHFIATCRERIKAEKEAAKNREISNIATDIQQPRPETNNNQGFADLSYQSVFPSTD